MRKNNKNIVQQNPVLKQEQTTKTRLESQVLLLCLQSHSFQLHIILKKSTTPSPICVVLCCVYVSIFWSVSDLPGTVLLKKTGSSFPRSHQLPMNPYPFHAGVLTGLILCRSCRGTHIFCEFMSASALSCLGDCFILVFPDHGISQSFCLLFSDVPWDMLQITHWWLSSPQILFVP